MKTSSVKPGDRIGLAVGSRGIENLPEIVGVIGSALQDVGAKPFLVPAMGSHGHATAEGQAEVLRSFGLDRTGLPIHSAMETRCVGTSPGGVPVHTDAVALDADGIIVINRIKPHVSFRGKHESGILKMIVIGLGNQKGAELCHRLGFGTMARNIKEMSTVSLNHLKLVFGVGILENAYHKTERIEIILPSELHAREAELQAEAKRLLPRIYPDPIDVLVVDEIGKDISGTGFDTNVVGRYHSPHIWDSEGIAPKISRMVSLRLTAASHGNANGVGNLDVISRSLADAIEPESTYLNALTSSIPLSVKTPMTQRNDRLAIQAAIKMSQIEDWNAVRLVRIRNTLRLDEIEVSENYLPELAKWPELEAISDPAPLTFDEDGNLPL